jgi:hypothetical protein
MKIFLVLVVLSVGGYVAYAKLLANSPARACAHMKDLCAVAHPSDEDQHQCDELLEALGKGEDRDRVSSCMIEAKQCSEAVGCAAGGAVRLGVGAAKGMLNGFQKAVQ